MKKAILLIAVAMLFCSEMKAQDLALATPAPFQLNLAENTQTDINSIFSIPMPESDLVINNQFNTEQYASRKGWGIFCIISGGMTMISGVTMWLGGDIFNNMGSAVASDDPMDQQASQTFNAMGNGVKTIGIVGAVAGAALVGTGIWLVSSDGGSSHGRGRSHGRRGGHRRSHRRHADLFQQPTIEPD
jgi:hypothetical protein